MKKNRTLSPHDKAVRLVEGGIVEIANDTFICEEITDAHGISPCINCTMDSICTDPHIDVCNELDTIRYHQWRLKLAHPV